MALVGKRALERGEHMSVQAQASDVDTLAELGYAQELRRRMSSFSNFAVSFTIISILSGCITTYLLAMNNGGPLVMTTGWVLVGGVVTLVASRLRRTAPSTPTPAGSTSR